MNLLFSWYRVNLCLLWFQISSFSLKMYDQGRKRTEWIVNHGNYGTHSFLITSVLSLIYPKCCVQFPHHLSFRSWCKVCLHFCFVVWATLLLLSALALTLNMPISTSCLGWVTKEKCFIYSTPLLFSCFEPSNSSFIEKKQCVWQVT